MSSPGRDKRKYKKNRTEKNKEELNNSEKYYKRTLDKNQNLYRNTGLKLFLCIRL
jgi:hypothetical protein